ncbi:YceD family protein [Cohnella abietis]|uniref:DUF177 domain-containing protein n=1 Tax=Cohnella abietis TaxID=2507935 RepID=A0A3T1D8R3_9BACL|nr:DUF177 domain-containing protein [Cohnella abietis]BBI34487.1 hypothetical protein KCTCHS21_38860 [Cohnella abietis]
MLLKVQELVSRQQPLELQGTLDMTDMFRNSPEYSPLEPMKYDLVAEAADDRILVSGNLTCNVRMQCSRCLDIFDENVQLSFEEQFRIAKDGEAELNEDDEAVLVTEERIDLSPYLAQELVVQLPYAPLCSEDCKGLCPDCGINLNEQSCGCNTGKVDIRMAALQDWFKSQKE